MKMRICISLSICLLFAMQCAAIGDTHVMGDNSTPDIIATLDAIPKDASLSESIRQIETELGIEMVPMNLHKDYSVFRADDPTLTLFGYPILLVTLERYAANHALQFFADSQTLEQCIEGEYVGSFGMPDSELVDANQSIADALTFSFELYERFGSSFGEPIAGGITTQITDALSDFTRAYSLPFTTGGDIDTGEIQRLFQSYGLGQRCIFLETDHDWLIVFVISHWHDRFTLEAICYKSETSIMDSTGFVGFEGPDGDSRHASFPPVTPTPMPLPTLPTPYPTSD